MLDELTSAGEVLWAGAGGLPGGDGWISLVPADLAPLLLPEPLEVPEGAAPILEQLAGGQALFFRGLSDLVGATDDTAMADLVWDLVWAGVLTNDTLAPLRTRLGGGGTHRSRPAAPRARVGQLPVRPRRAWAGRPCPRRTGPPTVAGRWSRLPEREPNATRRTTARTEALLERHGVLTRGAVMAEQVVGGFSAVYPVLRAFEENNRARRGYFVETLGAAQFGTPGSIDRLRTLRLARPACPAARWCWRRPTRRTSTAPRCRGPSVRPPATPRRSTSARAPAATRKASGHRAGRKAGALVVLVDGELVLYVERGGKTLLSWTEDEHVLKEAATALSSAVSAGRAGPDGRAEGRRRLDAGPRRCRRRCRRPVSPRPREASASAGGTSPRARLRAGCRGVVTLLGCAGLQERHDPGSGGARRPSATREGGNPETWTGFRRRWAEDARWIPAFAGMTRPCVSRKKKPQHQNLRFGLVLAYIDKTNLRFHPVRECERC